MNNIETNSEERIRRIKNYWDSHPFFASFFVFSFFFILFSIVYLSTPGISSWDDHFFHMKYAHLLRTQGWDVVDNFHWIYLTNTSAQNAPHQVSLFQIALIPFTFIGDLVLALKISDIFWASLCLGLLYFVFRKTKIKLPFLFVSLLLISSFFIGKIFIGRALVLVIPFVFLEIYLAINKKYFSFFLLALFHILWHQASFLWPIIIAVIVEAARFLDNQTYYKKIFFAALTASLSSFVFFPKFPMNLLGYAKSVALIVFSAGQNVLKGEGSELYPVDPMSGLLESSQFFLLFSLLGLAVTAYYYIQNRDKYKDEKKEKNSGEDNILVYSVFIFLSVCLLASFTISGRFFDFYFPASVYLLAIVITKLINEKKMVIDMPVFAFVLSAIVFFFIAVTGNALIDERAQIYKNDYEPYRQAACWVDEKSPAGEKVFLQNWSWFAISFFFNSNNYYSMGIEPVALKEYDSSLYWKWSNMFQYNIYCEKQNYCEEEGAALAEKIKAVESSEEKNEILKESGRQMIESIKRDFGSKYIISDSVRFSNAISLNNGLILDSFKERSEVNGMIVEAFQLK